MITINTIGNETTVTIEYTNTTQRVLHVLNYAGKKIYGAPKFAGFDDDGMPNVLESWDDLSNQEKISFFDNHLREYIAGLARAQDALERSNSGGAAANEDPINQL